jgi:hypothetical protein
METLGKIFYSRKPGEGVNAEGVQRVGFLKICTGIHCHFSRPLNATQKLEYDSLWGIDEHKKVSGIGHIIYRFGRDTMIHGYRGKGVYFTEDPAVPEWKFHEGGVLINPYWFWQGFVRHAEDLWKRFHSNREPTNSLKASTRTYLRELLE